MYKPIFIVTGLCLNLPALATTSPEFEVAGRFRHQQVYDDVRGDATADTLKTRLNMDWQASDSLSLFAQYDMVLALDEDKYNSITHWRPTSPIPDPTGAELNQLNITYKSRGNWQVKLGRQHLSFDNERHVGTAEFWQHDQSFDAVTYHYNDLLHWQWQYTYSNKVQRIFGDKAHPLLPTKDPRFPALRERPVTEWGQHQLNAHLFNLRYKTDSGTQFTLYNYYVENQDALILSSNTLGGFVEGAFKPASVQYNYRLEVATQKNVADNPWDYSPYYLALELGLQKGSHKFDLGLEHLGDDQGFAFITPLATEHKFQGWADVFSGYSGVLGMNDYYLSYMGRDAKLRWRLMVHRFVTLSSHEVIGHEVDLEVAYRFTRKWEFKLIAAHYMSDEGSNIVPASLDTLSTWMLSAAYNL
jgi:hypothetical protein